MGAGLPLDRLIADRAEYIEMLVDQHSLYQSLQAKAREAEVALYHMQGAFEYIEKNIKEVQRLSLVEQPDTGGEDKLATG